MLKENGSADDTEAVSSFFVSSTDRPIYNPSNDLKRLHDKYNVPSVSCGYACRAAETAAKNLTEVERNAVARLLGHTPETAEKHYRMRTPADAFLAQRVVEQLARKPHGVGHDSGSRWELFIPELEFSSLSRFTRDSLHVPVTRTHTIFLMPKEVSRFPWCDLRDSLYVRVNTYDFLDAEGIFQVRHFPEVVLFQQYAHSLLFSRKEVFLGGKWSNISAFYRRQGLTGSTSRESVLDEQTAVAILMQSWPVTLDGPPPKRTCRQQICGQHERHCYDRWRSEQLKLSEQHVLEHFGRRRPSQSKMEAWVEKQGWSANVPQASVILQKWTPFGSLDSAPDSDFVGRMIRGQGWKGLTVRDVPERGCAAVLAKRDFQKGEVIFYYHGQLVS
ncbi:uncharacterized protein [Garra rufa]|uniref:uncharacterized protein n=1 Tax=Garra rufa TaxID=137080 RepID=UPI003CCEBCC2